MQVKYCSSCGHLLVKRDIDGNNRIACPECNFVFWGNYSIGVGALVLKDNKVLLVRRAIDPGKGLWTNPGGYIEQHEPIEQTVVREVLEESGVSAMVKEVVAIRDLPRDIHNLYVAFSMEYIEGEPCPDGMEVDAAGFFSLQEIEHMNVAGFTRWLVDVAFHGKNQGLIVDQNPIVPLTGYSLFRVSTHL